MSQIIFISAAVIFYLSLATGAFIRHRKLRTIHTKLQLYGSLLPLLPAAVIGLGSKQLSTFLFTAMVGLYALTWLCMSTGYLLEAVHLEKESPDE